MIWQLCCHILIRGVSHTDTIHYSLFTIHSNSLIARQSDKQEFDCLQKKKPPELGALMIARRMPVGISVPKKANDGPSPRVSSSSITARLPTPDPGSAAFSDPSNGSQGLRFTVRLRRLGTVGIYPFRNTVICPAFYHTFRESAMVFSSFQKNLLSHMILLTISLQLDAIRIF